MNADEEAEINASGDAVDKTSLEESEDDFIEGEPDDKESIEELDADNGELKQTGATTSPRDIDEIEPDEIIAVIREVIFEHKTLNADDLIRKVAHALGYARTGSRIHSRLKNTLRTASLRGVIARENQQVVICTRCINDYSRDELIKALLAAIGRAWTTRDDAIRYAARYLGFRRTGSAIRKAFKAVINGAIRRRLLEYEGSMIRRVQ